MIRGVDPAQRHQVVVLDAQRLAERSQMLLDEIRMKPIVTGGHRRVGGEDDLRGDPPQRLPGVDAFALHAMAHQLEGGERAVPFVEMRDARRDAHRDQRAHAADAEQQLLADADAVVTWVIS